MKYAFRALRNSRSSTVIAVLALALGIGANTAIFSVVNAVFLRPLPYPESERLVEIAETSGNDPNSVSYPNYQDWKAQQTVFEGLAANAPYDATLEVAGAAERLPVTYVDAAFLSVLRARPLLGRDFHLEDDRQGASPVAILSHRIWQTRFNSNPAVLGATISLDRRPYTVIGVLQPEFHFYRGSDVFLPLSDAITRQALYLRENHNNIYVIARLKPGVSQEQAQAQMTIIARRLERAFPATNTGIGIRLTALHERLSSEARRPVMILLGAVALVLLIACVNVANLLLARAADRRKEMALRAALGASRWQVLRQLLLESVLLAVTGGVLGTLLASWSFAGLLQLVPASIAAGGLIIDFRVLGFTLAVCLLTGTLFGLAPAFDAWRLDLNSAMHDGGRTIAGDARGRVRDILVVAEVALALVLLVGAGLLLRTLNRLLNVPLGFRAENVLTVKISLPDSKDISFVRSEAFFDQLASRVRNIPGVRSAGLIDQLPLTKFFSSMMWFRDDRPVPERGQFPGADQRVVSPEYFAAMGIPLLKGRYFTRADGQISDFEREKILDWVRQNHFSVLINETMATRFWPGEDPTGKTFQPGFPEMKIPPVKILGVVGDVRDYGPDSEPRPTFYWSSYHSPTTLMSLAVRTQTEPAAITAEIRRATAELNPSAIVTEVRTGEQLISGSVADRRLHMLLLAIFAGLALVLAAVGIYGVMSYAVRRRTQEIGLRIALGADQNRILRMVIGKAVLLGGLGVVIGSAAAFGLAHLIEKMLFGVKTSDPATFVAVAAILFTVAVTASCAPAARATRVDPLTALRAD